MGFEFNCEIVLFIDLEIIFRDMFGYFCFVCRLFGCKIMGCLYMFKQCFIYYLFRVILYFLKNLGVNIFFVED